MISENLKTLLNYKEGLNRFANKEDFYLKYILRFPNDSSFEELTADLNAKDYEHAFVSAHKLKGVIGNLSFNPLYGDVCPLVEALRNKEYDDLDEMWAKVQKDYEEVIRAIQEN